MIMHPTSERNPWVLVGERSVTAKNSEAATILILLRSPLLHHYVNGPEICSTELRFDTGSELNQS